MVTVTFVKIGYIATTTLIDALLDERGARRNLTTRVVSSGVNMNDDESVAVAELATSISSDLYIIVSPNAALSGPTKALNVLKKTGKPVIVVSDEPSLKKMKGLTEEGIGFIVIYGDPMIGAKQQFLDPIEMALFNADAIRVLAVSGAFRILHTELDKVINALDAGENPKLPRIAINKETALAASKIENPYAIGKALAAYESARQVAKLSTEGTFKIKEKDRYMPILTAAHELMREAALMVDEAREIEKYNDTATRVAHFSKGDLRTKKKLFENYSK
jgi:methylenetetrahydromethanopterin dehydrogenase